MVKKAREEERSMDASGFIVKLPKGSTEFAVFLTLCAIVFMISFVIAGSMGHVAIFGACAAGGLFYMRHARRWRIEVRGDTITVVPTFGKTVTFSVHDISRVKRHAGGATRAYDSSGKRLFTIDRMSAGYTPMSDLLSKLHL
jgi:hypothetical protein